MIDPRGAPPEPAMQILGHHGVDCPKTPHLDLRGGYLHPHDDDGPYCVDGLMYCGRCHGWLGAPVRAPESATQAATERFNVPAVLRMLEAEAAAAFQAERTKIELVMRLIRQQQGEIERTEASFQGVLQDNRDLAAEINRLQRALAFWLPGVPASDTQIAQRAGEDAALLAGHDGDEPTAEELGWIRLREAP